MGQRGFWDEEKRIQKLRHKKPVLTTLFESIPWESFRSLLEQGYTHERKSPSVISTFAFSDGWIAAAVLARRDCLGPFDRHVVPLLPSRQLVLLKP